MVNRFGDRSTIRAKPDQLFEGANVAKKKEGRRICECECGGIVRGIEQFGRLWTWCDKCTPVVTIKVSNT
jgi:hypothetical protein